MKQPTTQRKRAKADSQLANISREAQCQRLLAALQKAGSEGITTIYAREHLNVMHPGGRVHELRHDHGKNIQSIWSTEHDEAGHPHRVARYILFPGKYKEAA